MVQAKQTVITLDIVQTGVTTATKQSKWFKPQAVIALDIFQTGMTATSSLKPDNHCNWSDTLPSTEILLLELYYCTGKHLVPFPV